MPRNKKAPPVSQRGKEVYNPKEKAVELAASSLHQSPK